MGERDGRVSMPPTRICRRATLSAAFTSSVVKTLRSTISQRDLAEFMKAVTLDMGFHFFALIHHDDLRDSPPGRVDIKEYPPAITERLIGQKLYRRDPVIRGCIFADGAFQWSELDTLIVLDRRDHDSLAIGAREGLNDGITVPCSRLGECSGSCTFAGAVQSDRVGARLGMAQMVGVFAFQAARRLTGSTDEPRALPRLHPKPRDCVILAGRGLSNKEIARALALTPRTVDGYLTEARRLFEAHDRTELVVSAVLAGEIGVHELRRQPE